MLLLPAALHHAATDCCTGTTSVLLQDSGTTAVIEFHWQAVLVEQHVPETFVVGCPESSLLSPIRRTASRWKSVSPLS